VFSLDKGFTLLRGFTLIELMIVVCIIGILLALSMGYIGKDKPRSMSSASKPLMVKASRGLIGQGNMILVRRDARSAQYRRRYKPYNSR
jgi:prepilin-type N-terminal cleavage/methylation domain-containing protein